MQFTQQTITILNREHKPEQIEAMVAENTGLGYYECGDGYIVTTTHSGRYVSYLQYHDELSTPDSPLNEPIIHRFIEKIAPWLDWSKSQEEIEAQALSRFGSHYGAQAHLLKAFYEISDQVRTLETSK